MGQGLGHRNKQVVEAARLHRKRHRRASGLTLIEGPSLLEEALAGGIAPVQVFALADDATTYELMGASDLDVTVVEEEALSRLAGTKTPRGPVAVIEIPPDGTPRRHNLLVSWGVSDPGNVGTLIRVAAAFDWDFGHVEGSADPWSPKTLRAGAGAHFRVSIALVRSLDHLSDAGFETLASVVSGGEAPSAFGDTARLALLIGEEAAGLPPSVVESADRSVTIPMPGGFDSLNAAVAAGVLVYALSNSSGSDRGGV